MTKRLSEAFDVVGPRTTKLALRVLGKVLKAERVEEDGEEMVEPSDLTWSRRDVLAWTLRTNSFGFTLTTEDVHFRQCPS